MATQKLVRVKDDEGDEYIKHEHKVTQWDGEIIQRDGFDLEDIAFFCDHEAEGRNNHKFVGVHELLAGLLLKRLGREVATSIMLDIAEHGGLDGLVNMASCWDNDARDEFGWSEVTGTWEDK
jgi:hypothetical protein